MPSRSRNQGDIRVVPAEQRWNALWQLFDWEPEPARHQRLAASFRQDHAPLPAFDHLLEAVRDGQRRGVAWGQPVPGRAANVWPPALVPGETEDTADRLQTELDQRLAAAGLACAQSLLPLHAPRVACLQRHGYSLAAHLAFLVCPSSSFPRERPASPLVFDPCLPHDRARLIMLVDQTYLATRDAPALNGVRATADVIEGYEQAGVHVPAWWLWVRHGQDDVGCLLLTDHPDTGQCELVYMGLIPEARGRGWGSAIVRHALWLAHTAQRSAMWLGVDAANEPARSHYARCGFREVDQRLAFFKQLSPGAGRPEATAGSSSR